MSEDIVPVVKSFILEQFLPGENPDEWTTETPLVTGGILDSIATLKLVMFLEERWGVALAAHETGPEHLDTISRIADLVRSKRA